MKNGVAQQPFPGRDSGCPSVLYAHQASAASADPKGIRRLRINGPYAIAAERGEGRIGHEFAIVEAIEAAIRAHEHVTIVVFGDGANPPVREALVEIIVLEVRAVPAAESTGCADPQILTSIFVKGLNAVVAQPSPR